MLTTVPFGPFLSNMVRLVDSKYLHTYLNISKNRIHETFGKIENEYEQSGAELGQAQLKLELELSFTCLH